ncbi:TetR/AcrR family transcriptional regulator [Nocardia alni]|uniref:TetR/AcrR family transcriptional regulator n=1 Tax=Nocardia alni TaxID=2815723 RepID=UPI001C231BA0|nr:TetR/AcrR family transcriptional regulator [Nocardia alni]
MTGEPPATGARRKRDRARTEGELLDAAERLFDRDGVLAGLNLNEVATESGVNRGQIYQMYGNRRTLLRAALQRALQRLHAKRPAHWNDDFAARRRAIIRFALDEVPILRAQTLLALDGDEDLHVFPEFDRTRAALERDRATGALPPDADGEALHVLTAAASYGYAVMREAAARDTGIPLPELDERVLAAYDRIIDAVTRKE